MRDDDFFSSVFFSDAPLPSPPTNVSLVRRSDACHRPGDYRRCDHHAHMIVDSPSATILFDSGEGGRGRFEKIFIQGLLFFFLEFSTPHGFWTFINELELIYRERRQFFYVPSFKNVGRYAGPIL